MDEFNQDQREPEPSMPEEPVSPGLPEHDEEPPMGVPEPPAPPEPPRRPPPGRGPLPPPPGGQAKSPLAWIMLIAGLVVLAFSVFLNFVLLMVVVSTSMSPSTRNLVEKRVSGKGRDKVAVITVRGVISRGQAVLLFPTADMVASVRGQLKAAEKDPLVKAVVIEVDSPGGTITASDLIHKEILDFKARSSKPVVVSMQGMAASGGYYISMAADRIVSHPTTLTGSIGVIMQLMNYRAFTEKHGIKWETFKPANAHLKDVGSPSKEMTDEERKVFQNMVEKMYDLFIDRVVEGRKGKLTREEVLKLANGQPYLGIEAKESGLVDALGTLEDAVAEAMKLANMSGDPGVVRYHKISPFAFLFGVELPAAGSPKSEVRAALGALESKMTPRLLFLYCP